MDLLVIEFLSSYIYEIRPKISLQEHAWHMVGTSKAYFSVYYSTWSPVMVLAFLWVLAWT